MMYFGATQMALNIHQKISLGIVAGFFILTMYDVLFHFLLTVLHILFEGAEWILDHLIEHLFETGMRETQIIVFYILMSLIAAGLYLLYRLFPRWLNKLKQKLLQQRDEALVQWRALSMIWKMAWWSFFIMAFNSWLFLT